MLEPEFWSVLDACALARKISLPTLIAEIDQARLRQTPPPGLASALRTFALGQAARSGIGDQTD